MQLEKRHNL